MLQFLPFFFLCTLRLTYFEKLHSISPTLGETFHRVCIWSLQIRCLDSFHSSVCFEDILLPLLNLYLKLVAIAFPIAQLLLLFFIIHNFIPFAFHVVCVSACVLFFIIFFSERLCSFTPTATLGAKPRLQKPR